MRSWPFWLCNDSSWRPCHTSIPASVTMNDGAPDHDDPRALRAADRRTEGQGDQDRGPCRPPGDRRQQAHDARRETATAPIDRSISPSTRTSITPNVRIASVPVCSTRFERLRDDRNASLAIWKPAAMRAKATTTGQRPRSPRRCRDRTLRWGGHATRRCGHRGGAHRRPAADDGVRPGDGRDDVGRAGHRRIEDAGVGTEAQHGDPVGDGEHIDHVVGDQDHGDAPVAERADQVVHHRRLLHAERGRGLVEHHDPRAPQHGATDGDRLALTSRQRRHRGAQRGERHRQFLEDPAGLEAHPLDGEEPSGDAVGRAAQLTPEVQVRHHVEVVAQREVLVHGLHPGSDGVGRESMLTGTPSTRIDPPSAACTPDSTLISVDLPAPLSPTSAITSAGRTSRSAPRRASTLPNDLKMPRISKRGVAPSEPRSAAERSSEVTCGGGVASAQVFSGRRTRRRPPAGCCRCRSPSGRGTARARRCRHCRRCR